MLKFRHEVIKLLVASMYGEVDHYQ